MEEKGNYPNYLTSKRAGDCKRPPKLVADLFECEICHAALVLQDTGWVCPQSLHGKILSNAELLERLRERMQRLDYRRWTPEGILYIQLRVQFWKERNARFAADHRRLVSEINLARNGHDPLREADALVPGETTT